MDITERAEKEKKRIISTIEAVKYSPSRIEALEPVIENTAWIKVKLDDARTAIKNSQVAIPYDNGGGQTGVRENPLFKGYEALFKTYLSGLTYIYSELPAENIAAEIEDSKPKTVLELVRSRHSA